MLVTQTAKLKLGHPCPRESPDMLWSTSQTQIVKQTCCGARRRHRLSNRHVVEHIADTDCQTDMLWSTSQTQIVKQKIWQRS